MTRARLLAAPDGKTICHRRKCDRNATIEPVDALSPSNHDTKYLTNWHRHHPTPKRLPNCIDGAVESFLRRACWYRLQKCSHPLSKLLMHSKSLPFRQLSGSHVPCPPCSGQLLRPELLRSLSLRLAHAACDGHRLVSTAQCPPAGAVRWHCATKCTRRSLPLSCDHAVRDSPLHSPIPDLQSIWPAMLMASPLANKRHHAQRSFLGHPAAMVACTSSKILCEDHRLQCYCGLDLGLDHLLPPPPWPFPHRQAALPHPHHHVYHACYIFRPACDTTCDASAAQAGNCWSSKEPFGLFLSDTDANLSASPMFPSPAIFFCRHLSTCGSCVVQHHPSHRPCW